MGSFLQDLQLRKQDAQDANAYRAMIRQAENESLARDAVARDREAYANQNMGYGLTRQDIADVMGRHVNEVSMDTLDDALLQQLGQQKMQNQRAVIEAAQGRGAEPRGLTQDEVYRQMAMQQAGRDMQNGQVGLASRLTGNAPMRNVDAQHFVGNIPTQGWKDQQGTPSTGNVQRGEILGTPQDDSMYHRKLLEQTK